MSVKIYSSGALVSSGMIIENATIANGGNNSMYINSGGVANSTTVNWFGNMYISSGGVANSTTVFYSAHMYISSGGVANSTTVRSGGCMWVSSGGVANSTTVNSSGWMRIFSGGTALNVKWTPCIGDVSAYDGAYVTYTSKYSGVYFGSDNQLLSHTQIMDNKIVSGSMYVMSGGVANSTTVNSDGYMDIRSGGVANDTTVNSSGRMYISSGGVANDTTVNFRGDMYIYSGGVANSTTVNSSGRMYISSGGVANDTTVNNWGIMYISSGGTANDFTLKVGGNLGGFSFNEEKYWSSYVGGVTEISDNVMIVDSRMLITSGGVANSTTVNFSGNMRISSGGTANSTTVNSYGNMHISSGGTANSTTVNSYGNMHISSGGTANSTTVNFSGNMRISSGGVANSTTVNSGGYMYISSGGVANKTTISGWAATMHIFSGGVANSTTVDSDGGMYISSGGVANDTTVNSSGRMYISSGGVANDTTVNSSVWMYIFSGGKHTGTLQMANGARVYAYEGCIIDFTVAERTVEDDYLINNLSVISGTPTYTITVSAEQADGTYKLAQGAEAFTGSITIGDGTTSYGSITVNGDDFVFNNTTYSLDQVNGNLTLSISNKEAASLVVTTTSDIINVYDGVTSLREAIAYAESLGGNQNITFAVDGTFNINSTLIITDDIIVNGNGADKTIFSDDRKEYLFIEQGGTLTDVTFENIIVNVSGLLSNTTLNCSATVNIAKGGFANDNTINLGGDMIIDGGSTNNINVNGGYFKVYSCENVHNTSVNYAGIMSVESDGVVYRTIINSGGLCVVRGECDSIDVFSGGSLTIYANASATNIDCYSGSILGCSITENSYIHGVYETYYPFLIRNGVIKDYIIQESWGINIGNNVVTENIYVSDNAHFFISGNAYGTINNGYMYISSDGVANSTTVNEGGDMYISSGGKLTGSLQMANGAIVSAYQGSIIDFTVAERTASDGYLINNLSLIQGTPTYTITVSASQESGTYKLAQGAEAFTGSITIGDGTTSYGSITVNGEDFVYNDTTYSLDQVNGNLTLSVENIVFSSVIDKDGNIIIPPSEIPVIYNIASHATRMQTGIVNLGGNVTLKVYGDLTAKYKNVITLGQNSGLDVTGNIEDVNNFYSANKASVTSEVYKATEGNDSFNLGVNSTAEFGSMDMLEGYDTVYIGNNAEFKADSVANVEEFSAASGSTVEIGTFTGSDASNIIIGSNAALFTAEAIEGDNNSMSVNFGAAVELGEATLNKLSVGNGVDFKAGTLNGTDADNKFSFGANSIVELGSVDFGDGYDTLALSGNVSVFISGTVENLEAITGNFTNTIYLVGGSISEDIKGYNNMTVVEADIMDAENGTDSVDLGQADIFKLASDETLTLSGDAVDNGDFIVKYYSTVSNSWYIAKDYEFSGADASMVKIELNSDSAKEYTFEKGILA